MNLWNKFTCEETLIKVVPLISIKGNIDIQNYTCTTNNIELYTMHNEKLSIFYTINSLPPIITPNVTCQTNEPLLVLLYRIVKWEMFAYYTTIIKITAVCRPNRDTGKVCSNAYILLCLKTAMPIQLSLTYVTYFYIADCRSTLWFRKCTMTRYHDFLS